MSTSIRISDATKRKLEALKREGESYDDLLDRLARSDRDVAEIAGFGPAGTDEHMRSKRAELNEAFEDRESPGEPRDRSDEE